MLKQPCKQKNILLFHPIDCNVLVNDAKGRGLESKCQSAPRRLKKCHFASNVLYE